MSKSAHLKPFACKGLENNIENLKILTKSIMVQVHTENLVNKIIISDDDFQKEVIYRLKDSLKTDFFNDFNINVRFWTHSKDGIVKEYFARRMPDVAAQRYFKVAVCCNSKGGIKEVLEEDIEPWVNSLTMFVNNKENRKYLESSDTRRQVIANLAKMLEFPISVKETPVEKCLTEKDMDERLLLDPVKYLPEGAIKLLDSGVALSEMKLMTSNKMEYYRKGLKFVRGARIKAVEVVKWAKYVVGLRDATHSDGVGFHEIVPNITDIRKTAEEVTDLKDKHKYFKHELRYPVQFNENQTKAELRAFSTMFEEDVMSLLKNTYMLNSGELNELQARHFRSGIIYGDWIDMSLKGKPGPIEVQIRDAFGHHLYTFNSPFGHNSKAYDKIRKDELKKKVEVKGREYSVDKITEYLAYAVMLPAFDIDK